MLTSDILITFLKTNPYVILTKPQLYLNFMSPPQFFKEIVYCVWPGTQHKNDFSKEEFVTENMKKFKSNWRKEMI